MVDFKSFQKLTWYYQILIVAVVCGALLAGFWFQYLSPIADDIQKKNAENGAVQMQLARTMGEAAVFEKFKKETEELQVQLNEMKKILPTDKETDQLLRQVQQSASTSSLRIMRVSPRPIIDHEVYTEWPIEMEVIGTYHNMGAYLDRIRQLPRIVNISNVKVHSRPSEGDAAYAASVGATYTATTFVYRDQQPIDSTAPPATAAK
jgi:type IV pilus assembly protein PilO